MKCTSSRLLLVANLPLLSVYHCSNALAHCHFVMASCKSGSSTPLLRCCQWRITWLQQLWTWKRWSTLFSRHDQSACSAQMRWACQATALKRYRGSRKTARHSWESTKGVTVALFCNSILVFEMKLPRIHYTTQIADTTFLDVCNRLWTQMTSFKSFIRINHLDSVPSTQSWHSVCMLLPVDADVSGAYGMWKWSRILLSQFWIHSMGFYFCYFAYLETIYLE